MPTSLRGIANRAKRDGKARFRNLYGLLDEANLKWCFHQLRRSAAPGIDRMTFAQYEENLDGNLRELVGRLKRKAYRAKLLRRKWIPKTGGKLRPLGIPALEDKLLQLAAARILGSIHEEDFLEASHGYRPGRGALQASRALAARLATGGYHWIVEADIRVMGYWNYYGVSGNYASLAKFWRQAKRLLHKWLNRRSHRRSYTWKGLTACMEFFKVPGPRIVHF